VEVGRRERKKEATRRALVDAAIVLFVEHGFEATTVEDIAEAVDVSTRTFHRYFPVKEDVLFADAEDRLVRFEAALAARPRDEDILDSLRQACYVLAESVLVRPEFELARQELLDRSITLRAHGLRHSAEWATAVADFVADRVGVRADDPLPQLLGGCIVSVLRTATRRWLADPRRRLTRHIDAGFDLLAHLGDHTQPRVRRRA
jgi:AcrR family transcriptional regulator